MENFDLTVIGAGPGGYVAAIYAVKVSGGSVQRHGTYDFPHPTVSEHIDDAARGVFGKSIHQ